MDVQEYFVELNKKLSGISEAVADGVARTAKDIIVEARQNNTYLDQTHYLRSSLAACVYKGGELYYSDTAVSQGERGAQGAADGIAHAKDIAAADGAEVVGVCTAAAPYASAVESRHGLNVLTANVDNHRGDLKQNIETAVSVFIEALK